MEFPGNQLGLFRQDMTDLKKSTLVTWELMCPKDFIIQHHKTDHYYLIRTKDPRYPSKLYYGGLGEVKDFESAKGNEYGAFGIDEPSEIAMDVYMQLTAQLRWTLPDGYGQYDSLTDCWRPPYQALLGSNPEPGWLEDHFGHLIEAATEDCPVITDSERVYVMALPKDNPYNPPDWERVMRSQADIPKSWIKKYLEGSWRASEGLVFKEIERNVHYIPMPPPAYLSGLSLVAALDHADTGIVCFSINGIDAQSNIISLASYYAKNKLVSVHSAKIRELCDNWVKICGKESWARQRASGNGQVHWSMCGFEYILIDPSTQNKTQQGKDQLWSIQDLYLREGIPTAPAFNAIEPGIKLMEEYIHIKPAKVHPFMQELGSPTYFIVKEFNQDGVKELESWKRTITVNKTIRYVGKDHYIDTQRYIIVSRPQPPEFLSDKFIKMTTHSQIAQRVMDKWSKSFGQDPDPNQWFGGGTGNPGQYFGRPN